MNLKLRLSFVLYVVNILVMLGIGLTFVFSNEFFPFHSEVIKTDWQSVDVKAQILYLGMMRTEGAGFLATATALAFLLYFPFRKREAWSFWAITTIGVVEYSPSLMANYYVASVTQASPPWLLMLLLMLSLFGALAFAILGCREKEAKAMV